ncbi:peptidylprolyl isomerase [Luteolibacter pohnpeiensis]|uniref:peptidylprolyl isomerase n=1 Tax=Luteolibacter pohnpeiensis TaxID=454153 RepID=A0A934S8Q9_9BACT|nr:peptidylprolyl isomerase [Luteolibacter pohnpeiensis]MBK1884222.1 peptidylprolyl isomerase [Luteolibacter pohnpeiensis]
MMKIITISGIPIGPINSSVVGWAERMQGILRVQSIYRNRKSVISANLWAGILRDLLELNDPDGFLGVRALVTVTIFFFAAALPMEAGSKLLPVLNQRIGAREIAEGRVQQLNPGDFFGMEPIDDKVVRFTSYFTLDGNPMVLDFAMFSDRTPATRSNFLNYIDSGAYVNSFIHRSVSGFVIQGGGYRLQSGLNEVPANSPVVNEFGISNTYGTIAMAKVGGDPDSATSQWFVNLGQNSDNLDSQNGGFTVFARMTKDTLVYAQTFGNTSSGYFPVYDLSSHIGSAFTAVPLNGYSSWDSIGANNFILFPSVSLETLPDGQAGEDTTLSYTVTSSKPTAVTAELDEDGHLNLTALASSGSATITLTASDSVGNEVSEQFSVTLTDKESFEGWKERVFSEADQKDDEVSGAAVKTPSGLTNLELFAHGLMPGVISKNPVIFSSTLADSYPLPSYTFPMRNDISGVSYTIEKSSDLGVADPWVTVDWTEKSRVTENDIDLITLESPSAITELPIYYRIVFTAP